MKTFKPLKNLEEIKKISPGEIRGVGQRMTETIPALCITNDGKEIRLLGNMDNQFIVAYTFKINAIDNLYSDGSIFAKRDKILLMDKNHEGYEISKKRLKDADLWEDKNDSK